MGCSRNLTQLPGSLCWMTVRTGEAQDVANLIHRLNEGFKHGLYSNTCVGWGKKNRFCSSDSFLWKSVVTGQDTGPDKQLFTELWGQEKAMGVKSCFKPEQPFQIPIPGKKNVHFHGARQTIQYKAVTGRVLMLPSIQISRPIPVNAFQIHIKELPKHQPTFHTPAGGQLDQHLIIK